MTEAEKLELEIMEKSQTLAALRRAEEGAEVPNYTFKTLDGDRKSTRLNSSHSQQSRMPSSA